MKTAFRPSAVTSGPVRVSSAVLIAAVAFMLSGCASMSPEAVERHQAGWKAGWVKRIGTADQLGARLKHDCRGDASVKADEAFALVSYPHGRTRHTAIGVVPSGLSLKEGQEVWVSTRDCRPIESR
jgi:hypothetical protein